MHVIRCAQCDGVADAEEFDFATDQQDDEILGICPLCDQMVRYEDCEDVDAL